MASSDEQADFIKLLFSEAEARGIPLWLESGWAIDARLGTITREHEDIDLAFAGDRQAVFEALLAELGCTDRQEVSYGFLIFKGPILLDAEPCRKTAAGYELEGRPAGSCPDAKEGRLQNVPLRCLSWEAIYWEFRNYLLHVPQSQWRAKDFRGLQIVEQHLSLAQRDTITRMVEHSNRSSVIRGPSLG
jgi:aminoglycoside 2''-adenylyltransferase